MKGRPVEELVYEFMFPRPKPTDPQNFTSLLQRYLVLEVRQEVHAFYGHLDTPEAKYPGLDYNHATHRLRLSRWPWHRRLFRAFDGLRLTHAEVSGLTRWEGTKWAKERYEKDSGCAIVDTTAEGFPDWNDMGDRESERAGSQETDDHGESIMEDDSDDEPLQSVGEALNERLRARVERINQTGDTTMSLDDEWEQWLKNAIESGEFNQVTDEITRSSGRGIRHPDGSVMPSRMMAYGRAGRWTEIPDYFHHVIRRAIENEQQPGDSSPGLTSTESRLYTDRRRTYSSLRLPFGYPGRLPTGSASRSARSNA